MADVARLAGVSKKTVSNYFNGYPYMTESTRSRIEQAIAELNYKVNISARNLSSGRTRTIALAIPEVAHPYFAELAQAVVSYAQENALNVVVEVTDGDPEQERAVLRGERGRYVDGIIFHPIALDDDDVRRATVDLPMVIIADRIHDGPFDVLTVANEQGAYDVTSLLLGRGRRRIVALGMEDSEVPTAAAQRFAGYRRALADAGVALDPDLLVGPIPWNRAAGASGIRAVLDRGGDFDAVFGFNDAMALGAMAELQRSGRSVPSDVAVVGFDDVEEAVLAYPALSTLDSGRDWIARTAVEHLAQRMTPGEQDAARTVIAAFSLIERDSI